MVVKTHAMVTAGDHSYARTTVEMLTCAGLFRGDMGVQDPTTTGFTLKWLTTLIGSRITLTK